MTSTVVQGSVSFPTPSPLPSIPRRSRSSLRNPERRAAKCLLSTFQTPVPLPLALIAAATKPLGKPRPAAPRKRNPPLGGGGTNPLPLPIPLLPPPPPSPPTLPLPPPPRAGGALSDSGTPSCSLI